MNGIGHIGQGGSAFDRESFRREASSILFEGTREMLFSIRDKTQLVAAYDKMDTALGELIERWSPPREMIDEVHSKLDDRLRFIGRKMSTERIDPGSYWAKEERQVAIAILHAVGYTDMRLDRLVDTAVDLMSQRSNLTKAGAEKLVRDFASSECRSLTDIMAMMSEKPNDMEFLSFISSEGTAKARMMAERVIDRMMPEQTKQLAVVIAFPKQAERRQPMRHQ